MKKQANEKMKLFLSIAICMLFFTTISSSATQMVEGPITIGESISESQSEPIITLASEDISPIDDAQVVEGYPTSNYGSATYLYVQSASASASSYQDERTWIKFDLTGYIPDNTTIEKATLRLYAWKGQGMHMEASAHGSLDDTWDETSITWNNQPSLDDELDCIWLVVGDIYRWYEWNVTSFVQNEWAGDKIVSFVVKPLEENSTTAKTFSFDSKEYGSGCPVLRIEYNGSSSEEDYWIEKSTSPQILDYAVGVTGAGDYIFLANSGLSGPEILMRYNTNTGEWAEFTNPGGSAYYFKNSVAMEWDENNYIYTLFGGSYSDCSDPLKHRHFFRRFNMTSNAWENLPDSPWYQGPGDALVLVTIGDNTYIYALLGTSSCSGAPWGYPGPPYPEGVRFWRYNVSGNVWDQNLTPIPYGADDGADLAWTGGDYIYAFSGAYNEGLPKDEERHFLRYSISENNWTELALTPYNAAGGVDDGGTLLYPGYGDYIYALKGGDDGAGGGGSPGDDFWRYKISNDSWEILPSIPNGVGNQNGHRLGLSNESIYCWRGCFDDGTLWAYSLIEEVLPDPDQSYITLTGGAGMHPALNSLYAEWYPFTVTVIDTGGQPIQGIPSGDFSFTASLGTNTVSHCDLNSHLEWDPIDAQTDVNGEIQWRVRALTSIGADTPDPTPNGGFITIVATVSSVELNDSDDLPVSSCDIDIDGDVDLSDFSRFAVDFGLNRQRSDYDFSGSVTLSDFSQFAVEFGSSQSC